MDCQNLWEAGPLRYILNTHPGGARVMCIAMWSRNGAVSSARLPKGHLTQ